MYMQQKTTMLRGGINMSLKWHHVPVIDFANQPDIACLWDPTQDLSYRQGLVPSNAKNIAYSNDATKGMRLDPYST